MVCKLYFNNGLITIYNENMNYFVPEIILNQLKS